MGQVGIRTYAGPPRRYKHKTEGTKVEEKKAESQTLEFLGTASTVTCNASRAITPPVFRGLTTDEGSQESVGS